MKLLAFVVQVAVVSAATVIFSVSTSAITVQEVPGLRPNSWVNDSINILSPKTEMEINNVIDQLEAKNSCEIMVITVPETTGYSSPREFALAWFNHWTVGKKGLDNGVLLMYSRGDDRAGQTPRDRIEIVTGWGLTEIFPDQEVVSLIQRDIRPRVNKREYDGAMLTGTQEIATVLQKYQPKPLTTSTGLNSSPQIITEPTTSQTGSSGSNQVPEFLASLFLFSCVFSLLLWVTSLYLPNEQSSDSEGSNEQSSDSEGSSSYRSGGAVGGRGLGASSSSASSSSGSSSGGGGGGGGGGSGGGGGGG